MEIPGIDQPLHFTYSECNPPNLQLKQGDILQKTPALVKLLDEVHPHYTNSEYKFFQVITQSCDLVRRGVRCKSRYITLAAVRSLDDVIERYIDENISAVTIEGNHYCSEKEKGRVVEFLRKLFNNNEKEYFFLEKSPRHGLPMHCCTLLYLSIAIRAYEHYDLCLDAKCLELVDNFQSKLGWMVGNLYSRVGTDDYVPTALPTLKELNLQLESLVEDHAVWVPQVRFPELKKISSITDDIKEIDKLIEEKLKQKKEGKLSSILGLVKSTISLTLEDEKIFKNLILNDHRFQKLLS
jgi:hypothetical protein